MSDQSAAAGAFEVIVIGARPAGEVLAGRLASAGRSTAVVERELVGGEGLVLRLRAIQGAPAARAELGVARRVPGAAEAASGGVDVAVVFARRDWIVAGS